MMLIHQPDINGTHAELNQPISFVTEAALKEFMTIGIFGPNTSFTIKKVAANLRGLANGLYITELGVAVYEADATTLVNYHPLSESEKQAIGEAFNTVGALIQTAGFFPKFEGNHNHGSSVYIHPTINDQSAEKLLARHFYVERTTRNAPEFARWLASKSTVLGLVEFSLLSGDVKNLPKAFDGLQMAYDSGGTIFVTPHGVNKRTTFEDMLDGYYHHRPDESVSIAGDSPPTDGSLFEIPDIRKIAVANPILLDIGRQVTGETYFAPTPAGAAVILQGLTHGFLKNAS